MPKDLTSYDLLKSLALILMVCDHVGYFFFPEEMWFRIIGRLCLPIWFFLIGYAKDDEVPKSFWIGGAIVAVSAVMAGQYLLPLNILFTLAFMRKYRGTVVKYGLASAQALRGMFFILLLLSFPSAVLVEYGSLGLLIALVGFIARRRDSVYERIEHKYVLMYVVAAFFATYIMVGIQIPYMSLAQTWVLTFGYILMGFLLWRFKPLVFTDARKYMAGSFIKLFQFMGRWTLEFYVVHLVLLRIAAVIFTSDRFVFGAWKIVDPVVLEFFIVQ